MHLFIIVLSGKLNSDGKLELGLEKILGLLKEYEEEFQDGFLTHICFVITHWDNSHGVTKKRRKLGITNEKVIALIN